VFSGWFILYRSSEADSSVRSRPLAVSLHLAWAGGPTMRKFAPVFMGLALALAPVVSHADDHYKDKTKVKVEKDGDAKYKEKTHDATGKHKVKTKVDQDGDKVKVKTKEKDKPN
jgi:hypothetical protein